MKTRSLHAVAVCCGLLLAGAVAARAATIGYAHDLDGNNDGVCPVLVNPEGGVYLRSGVLNYDKMGKDPGSYMYKVDFSEARTGCDDGNMSSRAQKFRMKQTRFALVEKEQGFNVLAFGSGWMPEFELAPGKAVVWLQSGFTSWEGPWYSLMHKWETKQKDVNPPPYPAAGAGYGWVKTNPF